jgi:uncharacterized repeat protein (TIGR03803 family)
LPASFCAAATPVLTTLASFDGLNGAKPSAGLIADAAGNLYGTASEGGASNFGTVFRYDAATGVLAALASFDGSNGKLPTGGLIADAAGNLFGTAAQGGTSNLGTVFRVDAGTGALTAVVSFNGTNGAEPADTLIADAAGNLYGTTGIGGVAMPFSNRGTVFKLNPASGALTTLFAFNGLNGFRPRGKLYADAAGNLFGTTREDETFGGGTVFRLAAGTNAHTTLVNFKGPNGANPEGGLIADAVGNLYGTTSDLDFTTPNNGTVFRLNPGTGALNTLATFNTVNGEWPLSDLIADAAGNLFGTTVNGGAGRFGTVFRLDAVTGELTTLASFDGTNGRGLLGSLIADAVGNLYGTTFGGGSNDATKFGTIFRISGAGFVVPETTALFPALAAVCFGIHWRRTGAE